MLRKIHIRVLLLLFPYRIYSLHCQRTTGQDHNTKQKDKKILYFHKIMKYYIYVIVQNYAQNNNCFKEYGKFNR